MFVWLPVFRGADTRDRSWVVIGYGVSRGARPKPSAGAVPKGIQQRRSTMLTRTRMSIVAVAGSAAMALGLIGAGPASAQPVVTGGLVNVTLVDVADVN